MAMLLIACPNKDVSNALRDRLRSFVDLKTPDGDQTRIVLNEACREGSDIVVFEADMPGRAPLETDGPSPIEGMESCLTPQAAHSLRSPLNSIIGMAELIQKPFFGDLNEKQLEFAKIIVNSGYKLAEAINKLESNDEG